MSIDLTLPDMSCGHCAKAVTSAVQRVDPQATLKIDLASRRVHIDSSRPSRDFETVLAEEGYPPVGGHVSEPKS